MATEPHEIDPKNTKEAGELQKLWPLAKTRAATYKRLAKPHALLKNITLLRIMQYKNNIDKPTRVYTVWFIPRPFERVLIITDGLSDPHLGYKFDLYMEYPASETLNIPLHKNPFLAMIQRLAFDLNTLKPREDIKQINPITPNNENGLSIQTILSLDERLQGITRTYSSSFNSLNGGSEIGRPIRLLLGLNFSKNIPRKFSGHPVFLMAVRLLPTKKTYSALSTASAPHLQVQVPLLAEEILSSWLRDTHSFHLSSILDPEVALQKIKSAKFSQFVQINPTSETTHKEILEKMHQARTICPVYRNYQHILDEDHSKPLEYVSYYGLKQAYKKIEDVLYALAKSRFVRLPDDMQETIIFEYALPNKYKVQNMTELFSPLYNRIKKEISLNKERHKKSATTASLPQMKPKRKEDYCAIM